MVINGNANTSPAVTKSRHMNLKWPGFRIGMTMPMM